MKNSRLWLWLLAGVAVGATGMWIMDPKQGARRRAQVRDKATKLGHSSFAAAYRAIRRSKHRLIGIYARTVHQPSPEVDDDKLTSRVRSEFGRKIKHARAVESKVSGGIVTLSGPVLKDEVRVLLECVSQVPGVKGVINKLEIHDASQGVSALQGRGKAYLQ